MKKELDTQDFERIWHFTFGVKRLVGLTAAIAQWMEIQTPSISEGSTTMHRCPANVAKDFFTRNDDAALRADYIRILESISILEEQHSAFLVAPFEADITVHLADTERVLNAYSDILEKLDYPGAQSDALSLRGAANKCLTLHSSA